MFNWLIIGLMMLVGGERATIDRDEIQQVITQYVHERLYTIVNDVIVEFRSLPESVVIERSEYSISVPSSVSVPHKGYAGIPVEIRANGKLVRTILCSVVIRHFEDVCVVTRNLEKNEVIQPIDISVERMETTNLENDVLTSPIAVMNTRAKRMINANSVLKNSMIEEIPSVNYNDNVVVIVKSNNLSIAASGIARQEGKIGEEIRIQRVGCREYISAKVVGKKTVEIVVR